MELIQIYMDGKITTAFTTKTGDTTTIHFHLQQPSTFDVLLLQENITIGQRIEDFVLEYKEDIIGKRQPKALQLVISACYALNL